MPSTDPEREMVCASPVSGTPEPSALDLWVFRYGRVVGVGLQIHVPPADGTWRESGDCSARPEASAPVDRIKAVE